MYIGIDLGGTNIAAGLVSEEGKILAQASTPTMNEREAIEIVKDMAMLIDKLTSEYGIDKSEIKGVGIGSPGSIDFDNGVVVYSNNLKMEKFPLAEELNKLTGLRVSVDNDANCAAMGEYVEYEDKVKNFIFVTLGTGVGSGIIVDGKMLHGFNGAAGEGGHIVIVHDGEPCSCGRNGCWEAYASVTALIRQTKAAMEKDPDSLMHKVAKDEGKVSGMTSFVAAKQGDKTAQEVVKQYAIYVAEGLTNLENIFQPEMICVGGGISREGDYLLDPVREFVTKNGYNKYMKKTEIVTAKLFNDAGIIGAAMIAR